MLKIIVTILICLTSMYATSEELKVGTIYRLTATVQLNKVGDTTTVYTALKNSKYEIISKAESGDFIVQFDRVYTSNDRRYLNPNWVNWDELYILPAKLANTVELASISEESLTGLSAGPLIVPFKYRTGDKSISGDATVGLYAGITFEPFCTKSNWCFRLTPLVSFGISQVAVSDGTDTDNKTSATWATGFLISSWSDLTIGVVYGEDRIGDSDWEHEGDGWISFMVGWEL